MRRIGFWVGLSLSLFFAAPTVAADVAPDASSKINSGPLTLATNAFLDAGVLPVLYTCDGKNVSPQFSWINPPPKTQSFIMISQDPVETKDAKYHWIVYVPSTVKELVEGLPQLPKEAWVGKNSEGVSSYTGPCPAKGSVQTYAFILYALDKKLSLAEGADIGSLTKSMAGHVLQKSAMTAVYSRWPK